MHTPKAPAPPPPPPDPTKDPAYIAQQAAAARQAEIDASKGYESTQNAGRAMALEDEQQNRAARAKLGYGS